MEKQLPKNIAEIYEALREEVLFLRMKRETYRQLYNSGEEVIKLLNFSGSAFFFIHKNILINDMLMTLRRLTDPKSSKVNGMERDNLSLKYLASLFDGAEYSTLRSELKQLIDEAEKKAEFARGITNRRIAHNDLLAKLKVDALDPFNMEMIDEAVRAMENILNKVISHWGYQPVLYEVGGMRNDSDILINRLRQARDSLTDES